MLKWQAPQKRGKNIVVEQCIFYLFGKLDNLVEFSYITSHNFCFHAAGKAGTDKSKKRRALD